MMQTPSRMSGVLLTGHGGPERLVWSDDLPMPEPGAGEVLVQVLAAGVNATDINTRKGWYARADNPEAGGWAGAIRFPRIQGSDLCGRVVRHGPGVSEPPVGARVICPTNQAEPTPGNPLAFRAIGSEYDGAFAEFCVVPARHLHDVSASVLSDIEIGAMPCAYGTAWNLFTRVGLKPGDRVLVTGASGGVGYAAVQLAVLKGAIVTAQCAAAKAGPLREAGARIFDRDATPPAKAFDIVIDVVGGAGWNARLDALKPGGRYATSGAIAGPMVAGDLRTVYLNDLTLFGCTHQPREVFAGLVTIINTAKVRPLVARVYPLREIARAQEEFETKRHVGKIVLIPAERNENG